MPNNKLNLLNLELHLVFWQKKSTSGARKSISGASCTKLFFLSKLGYDILIFQASTSRAGKSINDEAVFIKKFPRYEDVFCLGVEERSRSLKMDNALPVNMTDTIGGNNLENFQRSEFGFISFRNIFILVAVSMYKSYWIFL